VSPGEFIPVAEKIGLIDKLGEWSLIEGALCAARLHRRGWPTKVAINVSRAQLLSEGFLNALQGALLCANVAPQWIELELTESLFMEQTPIVQNNLRRIRDTGVGVAIDDFGTGVATFDYLKRFDVDYIKIDGAFIKSLLNDPVDRVIVESMVKVAHQLKVRTVAEFVSSPELHQAVTALGVDESQGFVFGQHKPLHEWFGESS